MTAPYIFKHSYSTINSFETCPLSFAEKSVYKNIKFVGNAASKWGQEVHSACELKIKEDRPLTGRFEFLQPTVQTVINAANGAKVEAEKELGIDHEKNPISFWDGRLRGKLDVYYKVDPSRGVITDWKAAKYAPSKYTLETDIFSFLSFCNDPELEKIKSVLVWVKQDSPGPPTTNILTRSDMPRLEDMIMSKMDKIDAAVESENFPPKRGGLCQSYCEVLSCRFNGKNK